MPATVVVGAQWGDEAKGKIVDVLADGADFVVRFSGGNNAGHTVITGGQEYKFHLLPAAILHAAATSVIGSGMVVCPKGLLEELQAVKGKASSIGRLLVSSAAHVVLPYHAMLDSLQEDARGDNRIGTTSRGIGPAYEDKVARLGIRMGEFVRPARFRKRLGEVLSVKNRLLQLFGRPELDFETVHEEYSGYAMQLAGYVCEVEEALSEAVRAGKRVLLEGAQGALLDLDSGTYPYVTSSHPVAGGACLGTGLGPRDISAVLGVCKAYTTRVGEGPFPTELLDQTGEAIRERGQEYGTTTGRSRRCGWLDLVALRKACRINSLSGLVLTRLDVLGGFERLQVCTGYRLQDRPIHSLPSDVDELREVEPIYESLPGWNENLSGARRLEDLPSAALQYMRRIEAATETPVAILSIGPDREQTIVLRPELIWAERRA